MEKLHIDSIDLILFFCTFLYIVVSAYSNEKDKRDLENKSYKFSEFWIRYNDNTLKLLLGSFIAFVLKDEIAMPILEYLKPDIYEIVENYGLNYSLTVGVILIVNKYIIKYN